MSDVEATLAELPNLVSDEPSRAALTTRWAATRAELPGVALELDTLVRAWDALLARPTPLADAVRQRVRMKLFVGAAPKIASYAGTGPLGAWLRVVTIRCARDLHRTTHP